ncbi:MAG: hypothetical protein GQ541_04875 [Desulfovibrionaceae bacterium]|nr:hypothetical protein [Desulfovibrionaceae bacterium]
MQPRKPPRTFDRVRRLHLSNGARKEQINRATDLSEREGSLNPEVL